MSKSSDMYALRTLRSFLSVLGEVRSLLIALRYEKNPALDKIGKRKRWFQDRLRRVEIEIREIVEELE